VSKTTQSEQRLTEHEPNNEFLQPLSWRRGFLRESSKMSHDF